MIQEPPPSSSCAGETLSSLAIAGNMAALAAQVLGVDSKAIAALIADGTLAGAPRGTSRLPQQGGDTWTIEPAELRRYILDNLERIDIRKVEKHSFVSLIAQVPPDA
jgi:hypothetical protein